MLIEVTHADVLQSQKSRVKAFSALASQGAAIIRSRSMPDGELRASFGPLAGFWKTWSDGSFEPDTGRSAIGGLVADERGHAVAAFSSAIEPMSSEESRRGAMLVEMKALQRALELAWEAGAKKLEVRFDCMPLARAAAGALMGASAETSTSEGRKLLAVMERFECLALRWTPRESNRLADALSKRPFGGGLFFGGDSQMHRVDKAWSDPERGLIPERTGQIAPARGFPEDRRERARERSAIGLEGLDAQGRSKIAIGACWRESPQGGAWIAAASCVDPMARRDGKIEQSGAWSMGSSTDKSVEGLSAALIQALAKKGAAVCSASGARVEKFNLYLPKSVWAPLEAAGLLESFMESSSKMLLAMSPAALTHAVMVEEATEVSSKHASHLTNGWELGRAAVIQELKFSKGAKRKAVRGKDSGSF